MNLKMSAVLLGFASLLSSQAHASDTGAGVALRAVVEPFCRIRGDEGALHINSGVVELGVVREVCNTRGGYRVQAHFINVRQGALQHGVETTALDSQGLALYYSSAARSRSTTWRLSDAQRLDEDQPVFMRLMISPI